ncbi:MAG: DEAD/DEAH box helicase, partial [Candidatus Diapherotrites archaeon]
IGGESILVQERELKEAQIVVATPGRLLDLIRNSKINFNGLRFLVIDEIDRMVDLGFIDDIEKIIAKLPTRQTIVLSATLSKDVKKFIEKHVKKALYVYGEKSVEEKFLKQIYYEVERKDKFSLLVFLLKKNYDGLSLVFCKKRQETDLVAKNLRKNGFDAIALHGGLKHKKRLSNIHDVINQKVDVVVATDLAARGLDLKGIKYVYNYDLPEAKEDYIHRVGRTARIGKEGVAITFLVPEEKSRLKKIVEEYNIKIQQEKIPNFPYVPFHVKLKRKYMSTKKK